MESEPQQVLRILGDTNLPPSEQIAPKLITAEQAECFLPHLIPELRREWKMIYNNYSDYGTSIRQFQKHVCHRGPTLIVIKDKMGTVFGCYASHSWEIKNEFQGDSRCFLFRQIEDGSLERIEYSGKDKNYMYFNLGMASMPNGIAMGGRFDIGGPNGWFALYIDPDLKFGESHAKTMTFEKQPCIASSDKFEVDLIEVIRLSEPSEEEEAMIAELMAIKQSALIKNPDAKAILEATGKQSWAARAGVTAKDLGGTDQDDVDTGL